MKRDRVLQRLRRAAISLALLAAVLALVALWLVQDNPTINHTSRGDDYPCLAPYDTVLNDANNYPGGEPPPDGGHIERRCREAGQERFRTAIEVAVAAGAVAVSAGVVALLAYRRDRRPAP